MTDIGDDVTVSTEVRVDGTLTAAATAVLSVTSPSGVVTSASVSNPSTGLYEAIVTATAAGRWLYKWTTTDPDAVQHGAFDVQADPPRLQPLATVADLEARIGALTDAQRARADALLADASAKIRTFTRMNFDLTANHAQVLRPVGSLLRLPRRPVVAVDSVVALAGGGGAETTLTAAEWTWDGLDLVELWPAGTPWSGRSSTWLLAQPPDTYRVTWDHGYAITPDLIVAKTCEMVLRTLTAPTLAGGVRSETIGSYSYQLDNGGLGVAVLMTDEDRRDLARAGFRRAAGTIQLKAS